MFKSWWKIQGLYDGRLNTQIFTALKYCRGRKPFNVLKTVNTENKYLFGRLLETQKERRKNIRRQTQGARVGELENTEKKISASKEESGNVIVNSNNKCNDKKKKQIPLKLLSKDISNNDHAGEVPFSSAVSVKKDMSLKTSDCIQDADYVTNLDNRIVSKKATKRKVKSQVKAQSNVAGDTSSLVGNEDSNNAEPDPDGSSLSQFIFKSTLLINETNFPLESREKLPTSDSQTQSLVSFGFNDPQIKGYAAFPSVSKIIEETMSSKNRMILNKWRENMIKELGQEGFNEYNVAVKERGSQFHSAVRDAVLGRAGAAAHTDVTRNALRSLSWLMEHISCPLAVESVTAHPALRYKGIPDCVALFRNIPVVVDWKLSDKPKKDLKETYDAPVQITAYISALNHDPNYSFSVNHGLVAVAYANGDPCDVFLLAPKHCQIYWRHWLMRFDRFKARCHLHLDHTIDERDLSVD